MPGLIVQLHYFTRHYRIALARDDLKPSRSRTSRTPRECDDTSLGTSCLTDNTVGEQPSDNAESRDWKMQISLAFQ